MHFILRRVITYVAVVFAVANLDFFLPRLAYGNPAIIFALNSRFPAQAVQEITIRLGLGQPLYTQYVDYLRSLFLTFPPYLGISYIYFPLTVWDVFASQIGWDLLLISTSLVLGLTIAYVMGALSSMKRGGMSEFSFLYSSIVTQAIPAYWIAMVTLWIFAVSLGWFPVFGSGSGQGLALAGSIIYHLVLPVVVMGVAAFGHYYLLLRGTIQEILKGDFVLTAQLRGLKETVLARRYVLRNALLPLVSVLTFSLGGLISETVVVENIFGYPGVGGIIVDAVGSRDFPLMTGLFFLLTVMVVIFGLAGDVIMYRLDPRLRG